ncbi:MAG: hypothetical protein U1E17_05490 [Geminicoccaceae bacterium]
MSNDIAICPDPERLDPRSRAQIEAAARLLRTIAPVSREIELRLHELARQLEWLAIAETLEREPLSEPAATGLVAAWSNRRFP